MLAKPQKEHEWLHQLVGEWTSETFQVQPTTENCEVANGTETVSSIGGMWVRFDGRGKMPDGSPAIMQTTLGYDPAKGKFVGNWVGSMMPMMWVYEGTLNEDGTVLTLDCEGPDFENPEKMARYQDIITIEGNERTLISQTLSQSGEWVRFMGVRFRRA